MRTLVAPGTKLSEYEQDSYSYRYALLDIAGDSLTEIREKLAYARRTLRFEFAAV